MSHYFGVIGDDDSDFMNRCYVSQRDYNVTFDGMRNIIEDSLSPYLQEYGIEQLEDTGKGGRLGGRLTKNIKKGRKGEVLVLFGGKGAGKSTFIKRLLHHNPPPWLREHSVVAILDLLKVPEDSGVIRAAIWNELVLALDPNAILSTDRNELCRTLFWDRFQVAKRQELAGLRSTSEAYNMTLNGLVQTWKADRAYCAHRLVDHWKQQQKGIIVVIDNTDQFTGPNQDFCFTSAQEIADQLGCITLISMREERFHNSKIHGLLDAFQNAGFHISSPKPAEVFRKRLAYTINLLADPTSREGLIKAPDQTIEDCSHYLSIVNREFVSDTSPLNGFLTACAHGDTRLSLDLFRSFLLSGYTNVEEMLAVGRWNFQIHQIIKPVMIPNRYFYDEALSDIPNIYQLRYSRHSSHFTAIRILRKLSKSTDGANASYFPVSQLKAYFVVLKHGFIEANNRLDIYSDDLDSVKITSYGSYMFRELAYYFTYLDLVCTDCGVFDEQISNYLTEAAKDEYKLFLKDARLERVNVRLNRVEKFIEYLRNEELRERDRYGLDISDDELFTHKSVTLFEAEKIRVLASAGKQQNARRNAPRPARTH